MTRTYLAGQWTLMAVAYTVARIQSADALGVVIGIIAVVIAVASLICVRIEDRRRVQR